MAGSLKKQPSGGLVLELRVGERVMIGEEIQVHYVEARRGRKVALRFIAPAHVRVDRQKIWNERRAGAARGAA